MESLIGIAPEQMLLHGPSKRLVDAYHWHDPKIGIVASYTPRSRDVEDHFGLFRGVDQIEAFAQASIVSCGTFMECRKQGCEPIKLKDSFIPAFISIGEVNFHHYLLEGETFISLAQIKFYKFRQMVTDGRIYKVPKGLDLTAYFKNYDESKVLSYALSSDFVLVAELFDITGRAIKREQFNT